jgi:hypothetical protein
MSHEDSSIVDLASLITTGGRALFGQGWLRPLAIKLDVPVSLLKRWSNGDAPVPTDVALKLQTELRSQYAQLLNCLQAANRICTFE